MDRDLFRISVHNPLDNKRFWARGVPDAAYIIPGMEYAFEYPSSSVPKVVAALRRKYPDQVVTVL